MTYMYIHDMSQYNNVIAIYAGWKSEINVKSSYFERLVY